MRVRMSSPDAASGRSMSQTTEPGDCHCPALLQAHPPCDQTVGASALARGTQGESTRSL